MSGSEQRDGKGESVPKPPGKAPSLTDAVVAALAKVDDGKSGDEGSSSEAAVGAEAGCAATQQPSTLPGVGTVPPPVIGSPSASPPPAAVASGGSASGGSASGGSALGAPPMIGAPPSVAKSNGVSKTNGAGFRTGRGSFADLLERWEKGETGPVVTAKPAAAAKAPEPKAEVVHDEPEAPAEEEAPSKAAAHETKSESAGDPIEVRYFGRTDVGLVREHNEDNYLVADLAAGLRDGKDPRDTRVPAEGLIFAVCDGMGGAAAGEVASQMAVDTIHEVFSGAPNADRDEFARRLVHSIEEAGHRIFSAAKMDRTRRGMGTTTTLAGLVDNMLFVGQVGDSRAYILRDDQFEMITKDQSLVNQLIEAGQLTEEEAEAFEHSNIILQALGTTEEVTVDLTFLEIREGDRLMMCSDGLSGLVHGEMMKEVLQQTEDLEEAANKLTQMANAGGGHDNITVILADFSGEGLAPAGAAKVAYQQYPLPPDPNASAKGGPARATSMKGGAVKPGADVKRGDDAAGPAEEVALPSSGGGTWKFLVAAVLLLAVVAGGYLAVQLTGGGDTDGTQTGTSSQEPDPVDPEPTEPIAEPVADPVVEPTGDEGTDAEATGTIQILSDVDGGRLFVNDEDRGRLIDGMTMPLAPGAYHFEARSGETTIAEQTVSLEADQRVTLELSVPQIEEPDPPPATTPRPNTRGTRRTPPSGRTTRRSVTPRPLGNGPTQPGGRTGFPSGRAPSGRSATTQAPPENPF